MLLKNTTLLLFSFGLAIGYGCKSKKIAWPPATQSDGYSNEAQSRMEYELERLKDPQTGVIPSNMRQMELAFSTTLPKDYSKVASRASEVIFENRGPINVGGRTRACAVDVANENRILAGSCSGGMWLSEDNGKTWRVTNTPDQLKNTSCLVQDVRPGHRNVWYYGSGESYGASAGASGSYYLGDGLFKSIDNGNSWQPVASTTASSPNAFSNSWQLVWNIAMDRNAPDSTAYIYAAVNGKIMYSKNNGNTWTAVRSGNSYFTDVAVNASGVAYATLSSDGSQKGIWRSTDGLNWTNILPQNFPLSYKRIVIAVDPNNENRIYFLAHTPGYGKITKNYLGEAEYNSLFRYTYVSGNGSDTGGVWEDLSVNLPATGGQFDKWNVQGSYDMVVSVKPGDPNTVFIGGTNLYRSTSAFNDSTSTTFIGGYEQFSALPTINSYKNHHPDQHVVFYSPNNPNIMYSANDGGIFKTLNNTADTIKWESLNNGYLTSMFYTVAIDHATKSDPTIVAGAQDNGSWYTNSFSASKPWISPRGGDGSYCAIADQRSMYYLSIQNAKMMKARLDASGNKIDFARIDPIGLKSPLFINPFTLDPNNQNIMYLAGGKYLWRNNDLSGIPLANNWDSISTNWTKWTDSVPTANSRITAIEVCKSPINRIYYGTSNRKLYKIDNANTGTPKAVEITSNSPNPPFPSGANISCIASDPNDGNKILVSFSNYNVYSLFYSEDGGTTWAVAGGNLEPKNNSGPSVRWVKILPVKDGNIYFCATSIGLFAAKELKGFNTEWIQQGSNLIGNAVCDMIDARESDGYIVVATHANGIFSANYSSITELINAREIETNPLTCSMYPNPNAGIMHFNIDKKVLDKVDLEIWDPYGRILYSKEIQLSGTAEFTAPLPNLSAGQYYYSLKSSNFTVTRPFILENK